jgi:hypothetical protein
MPDRQWFDGLNQIRQFHPLASILREVANCFVPLSGGMFM